MKESVLMKQYRGIKEKHPDAIVLFRVNDFYEAFNDDAVKISEILGITLTTKAIGVKTPISLAGFPFRMIDDYLPKLVRAGNKVAICEQQN